MSRKKALFEPPKLPEPNNDFEREVDHFLKDLINGIENDLDPKRNFETGLGSIIDKADKLLNMSKEIPEQSLDRLHGGVIHIIKEARGTKEYRQHHYPEGLKNQFDKITEFIDDKIDDYKIFHELGEYKLKEENSDVFGGMYDTTVIKGDIEEDIFKPWDQGSRRSGGKTFLEGLFKDKKNIQKESKKLPNLVELAKDVSLSIFDRPEILEHQKYDAKDKLAQWQQQGKDENRSVQNVSNLKNAILVRKIDYLQQQIRDKIELYKLNPKNKDNSKQIDTANQLIKDIDNEFKYDMTYPDRIKPTESTPRFLNKLNNLIKDANLQEPKLNRRQQRVAKSMLKHQEDKLDMHLQSTKKLENELYKESKYLPKKQTIGSKLDKAPNQVKGFNVPEKEDVRKIKNKQESTESNDDTYTRGKGTGPQS